VHNQEFQTRARIIVWQIKVCLEKSNDGPFSQEMGTY